MRKKQPQSGPNNWARQSRFFHGIECSKLARKYHGYQARKRHININFLVRLLLGHPGNVPGTKDKPGLSPGQSGFVPGTNPGFLLILHSGSPVCPLDKPSLSLGQFRGRRAADRVYVLKVYVPFPFPRNLRGSLGNLRGTPGLL